MSLRSTLSFLTQSGDFVKRSSFTDSWFISFFGDGVKNISRLHKIHTHLHISNVRLISVDLYESSGYSILLFLFKLWIVLLTVCWSVLSLSPLSHFSSLSLRMFYVSRSVCAHAYLDFSVVIPSPKKQDSIHFRRYIQSRVLLVHSHWSMMTLEISTTTKNHGWRSKTTVIISHVVWLGNQTCKSVWNIWTTQEERFQNNTWILFRIYFVGLLYWWEISE